MLKDLNFYINSEEFKSALYISSKTEIELRPLAQGEYNVNYIFIHPDTGQKLILRINTESQLGLADQIQYEYKALKLLEGTKRTPKAYFCDGSRKKLPYGLLVMEYLHGRSLDYKKDLSKASEIFADIHSHNTAGADFLIAPDNCLYAMLEECLKMSAYYINYDRGEKQVKKFIEDFLAKARIIADGEKHGNKQQRIINTEVNSGNFIINDNEKKNYLIDWEKPILGEPAQDLAHFMVPTTTFWKTDIILTSEEQKYFVDKYKEALREKTICSDIEDKLRIYMPLNCLRGVSWCAMAFVQYQDSGRLIKNEDTYKKILQYLSEDFLEMIKKKYFV